MNMRMLATALAFGLAVLAPLMADAAPYGADYVPSLGATLTAAQKALGQKAATFLDGLTPGSTVTVQVLVKNTGTLTWDTDTTNPQNPFHLSYHWEGPENIWDGQRTGLPKNVAPGELVTLNATLKVPATPGTYTLQWEMVHEFVTWFSSANVPVKSQFVGVGGRVGAGKGLIGYFQYLSELCQWTDCTGATEEMLKCPTPKIGFGGTGPFIMAGSSLYVSGCGFGQQKGLLELRFQDGKVLNVNIEYWYPGLIVGTVPNVPGGTKDQIGALFVKTGGWQSNPWPVQFKAKREIKLVPMKMVQVKQCSDNADENICNHVDNSDCTYIFGTKICPWQCQVGQWCGPGSTFASIGGYHYNTLHLSGDVGWDKYTATVKNGYVFHDIKSSYENLDGGHASNIEGFKKGGASTTFTMQWSVDGDGGVFYTIDLYAIGPKGVPLE